MRTPVADYIPDVDPDAMLPDPDAGEGIDPHVVDRLAATG